MRKYGKIYKDVAEFEKAFRHYNKELNDALDRVWDDAWKDFELIDTKIVNVYIEVGEDELEFQLQSSTGNFMFIEFMFLINKEMENREDAFYEGIYLSGSTLEIRIGS